MHSCRESRHSARPHACPARSRSDGADRTLAADAGHETVSGSGGFACVVDAEDTIERFEGDPHDFAVNGHRDDLPRDLVGKRIEDVITRPEVAHLVAVLLRVGRQSGKPVSVPYRIDGNGESRFLQMVLSPGDDDGEIEIRCHFRRSKRLQEPALSWKRDGGGDGILRICSLCDRIEDGDEWKAAAEILSERRLLERPEIPRLSHGFCPDCFVRTVDDID